MDISEASTNEDDLTEAERNVRILATQMLKQRVFAGYFKERKRVELLNDYRDVIVVNDVELKKDMDIVRRRLRSVYKKCWIGLTGPDYAAAPYGHCFWVNVDDQYYPHGNYLYMIKSVKFRRNEIIVRVKNLKSLDEISAIENAANETIETQVSEYIQNFSWDNAKKEAKKAFMENTFWFFTILVKILTIDNIKEVTTFLFVLLVTSGTFLVRSVEFFLNFVLKFMRELSLLVKAFTPIAQSLIDVLGKIIGGFYFLIASIYRDTRRTPSNGAPEFVARQRYLPIEGRQRQPVNYYRPRSSVVIREIDN